MICSNCGGQIPDGSKVCSFCETEVCKETGNGKGGLTDMEKRMAEILMGSGGCPGCAGTASGSAEKDPDVKEAHWWKDGEECGSCGGGITGPDKDLKYALTIVGLIAGVIVFALAVKFLFGF